MKKLLLIITVLLASVGASAQALLYEDFNNGIPDTWTMFTDSNTAHNANFAEAWSVQPAYGNPAPGVVSTSWFTTANDANRWLVTDAIVVPGTGYVFALEAACHEIAYPDGFQLRVSTTKRDSQSFFSTVVLNVNACDTNFTEYSFNLDDYAGDTVYVAIVQNSSDRNFLIVDNIRVCRLADEEIALTSLSIPTTIQPNTNVNLVGKITNKSTTTLTSFSTGFKVNDSVYCDSYQVQGLQLGYGETYTFTYPTPINLPEGLYNIEATIYPSTSTSVDYTGNNTLSTILVVRDSSADAVPRLTLIEQFTNAYNGNCYRPLERIKRALSGRDNYIWINHHLNDNLANAASDSIAQTMQVSSTPTMMIDRTSFNAAASPVTTVGTIATLTANMNASQAVPSFLYLTLSNVAFNESSRTISGTVAGHFTKKVTSAHRIVVYLVEDSVFSSQVNNYGAAVDFRHTAVVKASVINRKLMDTAFCYTLAYTLPDTYRAWRCRLVAAVYNNDASNAFNCSVANAATSDNFTATYVGIDEVGTSVVLNLYPNPADNPICVEADSPIRDIFVTNMMGQTCYHRSNINADKVQLNVSSMATGMYIVRVQTAKGWAVRKFSVVRSSVKMKRTTHNNIII